MFLMSGCVIPSNDIFSQKVRFLGVMIGQNPATQVPNIYLGYGSVVIQRIPTSTNNIYAPNYIDTFDLGVNSGNFPSFGTSISEDTGTGNFMLDTNVQSTSVSPSYKLGSRLQKK